MANRSPHKDEPAQDDTEDQAPRTLEAAEEAPATAVIGEEQELPPAAREFHCSLGFDVPSGIMPHNVGDHFTQTVDGESVEFEIVQANRNDDVRRVDIVAREVKPAARSTAAKKARC